MHLCCLRNLEEVEGIVNVHAIYYRVRQHDMPVSSFQMCIIHDVWKVDVRFEALDAVADQATLPLHRAHKAAYRRRAGKQPATNNKCINFICSRSTCRCGPISLQHQQQSAAVWPSILPANLWCNPGQELPIQPSQLPTEACNSLQQQQLQQQHGQGRA
jgi:hypothetical protein